MSKLKHMPIDWWLCVVGVFCMAWSLFGWPADEDATFALGMGLAAKQLIEAFKSLLTRAKGTTP